MFKYACLNPIAAVGLNNFSADYTKTEDSNDADAILVRSAAMHDMELSDNLIAIARAGAGVNNIPLDKCADKGIVVFNTPGANANGVKELVIAGMLLASRDIVGGIEWVKENASDENVGKAAEKAKKAFAGTEIEGKKLGVIGLGAIGVKVANAAALLGMDVVGYDPYLSINAALSLSTKVNVTKDVNDIYADCDFISIHVPLSDSTRKMIDKKAIDTMKDTAIVLNFARDALVDEEAMVVALEAGTMRGYVCDFANTTTAGKKGCIVIPHLGASAEESEDNCAVMAVAEVKDYLENGNIKNSVNYPACDLGVCTTASRVAVLHKNVKGTIGAYSSIFGDANINIAGMANTTRGDYAYALLDLDGEVNDDIINKLAAIEGVLKVRKIK